MGTRLDLLSPDLVKKLMRADEQELREIALSASKIALSQSDQNDALISHALGSILNIEPIYRLSFRKELNNLIIKLDEIQWNLSD